MRIFQWKTGHILETVGDTPSLLLITNRKWYALCQMRWKSLTLDDLEGMFGYPSESWVSCS